MARKSTEPRKRRIPGRAVDDEDPGYSPMDNLQMLTGPAQPYHVERVEEDRSKSMGSWKTAAKPVAALDLFGLMQGAAILLTSLIAGSTFGIWQGYNPTGSRPPLRDLPISRLTPK